MQDQILDKEKSIAASILAFGNGTGELQVKNVGLTALLMVVLLQSIEYRWLCDALEIPLTEYFDHMLEVIMNGIRKR